jgi:hypothetical protein
MISFLHAADRSAHNLTKEIAVALQANSVALVISKSAQIARWLHN